MSSKWSIIRNDDKIMLQTRKKQNKTNTKVNFIEGDGCSDVAYTLTCAHRNTHAREGTPARRAR